MSGVINGDCLLKQKKKIPLENPHLPAVPSVKIDYIRIS